MKVLALNEFPPDLLFEIAACLDLADVLNFLSVCHSFRLLGDLRHFWKRALEQRQKHYPLACPLGTDVSQLDKSELESIARHTHRVEKNWDQEESPIGANAKEVSYESGFGIRDTVEILAIIPGTSLVLLHDGDPVFMEDREVLFVVDFEAKVPIVVLRIKRITHHAHYDEPGRHLMAIYSEQYEASESAIFIVSVTYGPDETTTQIQQIFQQPLDNPCNSIFIRKNVVGYRISTRFELENSNAGIHSMNYETKSSVKFCFTTSDDIKFAGFEFFVILGTSLAFAAVRRQGNRKTYSVYWCPVTLLDPDDTQKPGHTKDLEDLDLVFQTVLDPTPPDHLTGARCRFHGVDYTLLSPLGLHALVEGQSSSSSSSVQDVYFVNIYFWPFRDSEPPFTFAQNALATACLDGHIQFYAAAPSGMYMVVAMVQDSRMYPPDGLGLFLLRYMLDPPEIRVRRLLAPSHFFQDKYESVGIDERYGVIYLSHTDGKIYYIPYA